MFDAQRRAWPEQHVLVVGLVALQIDRELMLPRSNVQALGPAVEVVHGANEVAVDEHFGLSRLNLDPRRAAIVKVGRIGIWIGVGGVGVAVSIPIIRISVGAIPSKRAVPPEPDR